MESALCTVSQASTKRANEALPQAAKVENVSNEEDFGWEMGDFEETATSRKGVSQGDSV